MEKIYFVGAGPGNPDLITVRGLELLRQADVLIYAGSLVNPELVDKSCAAIKLDSWGMSLGEMVATMEAHAKAGRKIVRLHSGDPSIYGAIIEQMAELKKLGIPVEVVPGVSSMFAAAAALQTQLTLKGVAESVMVTRPAGATLEEDNIKALSRQNGTLVVFLGTEKLEEIVARIERPADTPAAVVYHASWADEKVIRGTLADICPKARQAGITRTALLIIGGVVEPGKYENSVLYT